MQPWFALDMFKELRNDIEQLVDCLKVYEDYLLNIVKRVSITRK